MFVVPSYRIHTYNNLYHLERTEDIDDQVFLKRHQKHENDERKRKRYFKASKGVGKNALYLEL